MWTLNNVHTNTRVSDVTIYSRACIYWKTFKKWIDGAAAWYITRRTIKGWHVPHIWRRCRSINSIRYFRRVRAIRKSYIMMIRRCIQFIILLSWSLTIFIILINYHMLIVNTYKSIKFTFKTLNICIMYSYLFTIYCLIAKVMH